MLHGLTSLSIIVPELYDGPATKANPERNRSKGEDGIVTTVVYVYRSPTKDLAKNLVIS